VTQSARTGSRIGAGSYVSPPRLAAISVVVCTYSEARWPDLLAALASLRRQTVPPLETIVVVDHNEQLLARVRATLSDVIAVPNTDRRGLSGARNSGIAVARGDVVAFMDDDAVAADDWLERLAAAYADERVLGVGGAAEPAWERGRPRAFPPEFDWVVGCTYRGMPATRAPVRNLIGANMSFRREVLAAAGRFRSGIGRVGTRPIGCEETELCIRARRQRPDGVFLFEPDARVAHRVPPNRATLRYFGARCYAEGRSKAAVARLVGARDGLATERSYVVRTLSRAVACGVRDCVLRRDVDGLRRAAAVLAGLLCTAAGYAAGAATARLRAAGEA
jgi:cellulose synthase/poly-beta-1,6-N-acetylglucosamine synthase-like glycosyltransferase